jgi:hypothetical protein
MRLAPAAHCAISGGGQIIAHTVGQRRRLGKAVERP